MRLVFGGSVLLAAALGAGCGVGLPVAPDVPSDGGNETPPDAPMDVVPDVPPDADAPLDIVPPDRPDGGTGPTVLVDTTTTMGTVNTIVSTNIVWPGTVEGAPNARANLDAYAPPMVRLHVGTDGTNPPALPAGIAMGDWNPPGGFAPLDSLINLVRAYGGRPVVNVKYAPNWMWVCDGSGTGTFTDYATFAAYMARLVRYYNVGSMTTETGATVTNPAGTSNRIDYWEIWNEPDLSGETPCHTPSGPALTPTEYWMMWNAAVPAMRAVDPTILVVGPAIADQPSDFNPPNPLDDYVPQLLANGVPAPDVVSYHGYGGWQPTQTDVGLFDGDGSAPGLAALLAGLTQIQGWAGTTPVWITETNVNAAGGDTTRRPWTAFGAAWLASAYRGLVLGGAAVIHQYQFVEGNDLTLVDQVTGDALLPYFVTLHFARYFAPGSTLLAATSDTAHVEVLAARDAAGHVRVLVVNRQIASASDVGGPGVPASVLVDLGGFSASAATSMIFDSTLFSASPDVPSTPAPVPQGATSAVVVDFAGYGAALLDFAP